MKKILFCILLAVLVLAGCQNKIVDEDNNNQFSIQVSWKNENPDTASTNMLVPLSETGTGEKKFAHANSLSGQWYTAVRATLVDEEGNVIPDTEFTYAFSETPEAMISLDWNEACISFSEPGEGTLNVLANDFGLSTTIDYKVFATGYLGEENEYMDTNIYTGYDFESQTNQPEDGDIVYQEGYIYAPYGFIKIPVVNSLEEFAAIDDISTFEYVPGYLWQGDFMENALAYTFFVKTEEGGYVKLHPNTYTSVPVFLYEFYFDYSADGTF